MYFISNSICACLFALGEFLASVYPNFWREENVKGKMWFVFQAGKFSFIQLIIYIGSTLSYYALVRDHTHVHSCFYPPSGVSTVGLSVKVQSGSAAHGKYIQLLCRCRGATINIKASLLMSLKNREVIHDFIKFTWF